MAMTIDREAELARRIRLQLGEFNDDNLSVPALVRLLVEHRRAHLTQPAQAVDVVKLMEHLPDNRAATRAELIRALALTRALAGEKAGWRVPDGFAVALFNATEAYERTRDQFHGRSRKIHGEQVSLLRRAFAELLPASPTPDKEG
jgi:hypothetical protein